MGFLKRLFCKHKQESVAQYMKLPYGYRLVFVCKKCGKTRRSVC